MEEIIVLNFFVCFQGAMAKPRHNDTRDYQHTAEETECFNRRLGKMRKKTYVSFRVSK